MSKDKNYAGKTLRGRPFPPGTELRDACFKRARLRGVRFRNVDLTGADFTEADIRSADFTEANLCGATFTDARAGRRLRAMVYQSLLMMLLGAVFSFVALWISVRFITALVEHDAMEQSPVFPGLAGAGACLWTIWTFVWRGLVAKSVLHIAMGVIVTFVIAIGAAVIGAIIGPGDFAVARSMAVLFAGIGSVAVICIIVAAIVVAIAGAVAVGRNGATIGALAGFLIFIQIGNPGRATGAAVAATVAATVMMVLALYVAWKVFQEDERFSAVRRFGLIVGALGSTLFRGADLTEARFKGALLAYADFRRAVLARVSWREARGLNEARVEGSVLAQRAVRELLVTGKGAGQNWATVDLSGACLEDADLVGANFRRADLSKSSLCRANLHNAILAKCHAIGANFAGATLTGACLEAWVIDRTTRLENVTCEYVFLLERENERGSRERLPHDADQVFGPGDFEKLYTHILGAMELMFRNGVAPGAAHEGLSRPGQGQPAADSDSEVPEASFEGKLKQVYEQLLQLEAENRFLLAARDDAILLAMELARRPIQVNQIIGEGNNVSQHNDNRRSNQIGNIGGNFHASGQVLNQGDIHGSATANIAAAPAPLSHAQWQQDIKKLMAELTDRMDALEDEVWRTTTAIFKKLHALNMDGKTEEQALATVEQALDSNEKSTLRRALTEISKSGRSILEDMAAAGIWSALFGG